MTGLVSGIITMDVTPPAAAAWLALHPLTRRVSGIDFDDTRLLGAINVAVVGAAGNSGYWVAPAARGHQVARRALRLLTDWAFAELDLGVIILEIRAENPASMAVAIACGYHEAGRLDVNLATGTKGGLIFSRLAGDQR